MNESFTTGRRLRRLRKRIVADRIVRARRAHRPSLRRVPRALVLLDERRRVRFRKLRRTPSVAPLIVTAHVGHHAVAGLDRCSDGSRVVCFTDRPEMIPRHWSVRPIEYWDSTDQTTVDWIGDNLSRLFPGHSALEWFAPETGSNDAESIRSTTTGSTRWIGDQSFVRRRSKSSDASRRPSVTVVVPVHDAPDFVDACLDSVMGAMGTEDRLVVVDDGSEAPTAAICDRYAASESVELIRHRVARGFPGAANAGLRATSSPFAIVLNSDTVVPRGWTERLIHHLVVHDDVAAVGPVSNAARFQSIPHLTTNDIRVNRLPEGLDLEGLNEFLVDWAHGVAPIRVGLLNGFCIAFRNGSLERVGYFDETRFGRGFGEENDWCIRAARHGFGLLVAPDVYVHHAKGRSFDSAESTELKASATERLREAYGADHLDRLSTAMRYPAGLSALRADTQALWEILGGPRYVRPD